MTSRSRRRIQDDHELRSVGRCHRINASGAGVECANVSDASEHSRADERGPSRTSQRLGGLSES